MRSKNLVTPQKRRFGTGASAPVPSRASYRVDVVKARSENHGTTSIPTRAVPNGITSEHPADQIRIAKTQSSIAALVSLLSHPRPGGSVDSRARTTTPAHHNLVYKLVCLARAATLLSKTPFTESVRADVLWIIQHSLTNIQCAIGQRVLENTISNASYDSPLVPRNVALLAWSLATIGRVAARATPGNIVTKAGDDGKTSWHDCQATLWTTLTNYIVQRPQLWWSRPSSTCWPHDSCNQQMEDGRAAPVKKGVGARDVAQTLWAYAFGQMYVPSDHTHAVFRTLLGGISRVGSSSTRAPCAAIVGQQTRSIGDEERHASATSTTILTDFSPFDAANVLWSAATVGYPEHGLFFEQLLIACRPRLHEFHAQGLSISVWSLARLVKCQARAPLVQPATARQLQSAPSVVEKATFGDEDEDFPLGDFLEEVMVDEKKSFSSTTKQVINTPPNDFLLTAASFADAVVQEFVENRDPSFVEPISLANLWSGCSYLFAQRATTYSPKAAENGAGAADAATLQVLLRYTHRHLQQQDLAKFPTVGGSSHRCDVDRTHNVPHLTYAMSHCHQNRFVKA